jgi:hypothetical protein
MAEIITDQAIENAKELLAKLKQEANSAHQSGDMHMLDMYNELLKVASPIVMRYLARKERNEKADINKKRAELRRAKREAAASPEQP